MKNFARSVAGALLGSLISISSAFAEIVYSGGDGTSISEAVIIEGASGTQDGIASEYAWIAEHFPGWERASQAVMDQDGRTYDALEISKDGYTKTIYFDITSFFGKY